MITKIKAPIVFAFFALLINFVVFNSAFAGKCEFCRKDHAPSLCAACKVAQYCSGSCQREHWPAHKGTCKLLAPFKELKDSVIIAESPISGRGLFANQDFEPGQPVAVYYGQKSDFKEFKNFIKNFSNPYLLDPIGDDSIHTIGQNYDLPAHLSASMANDPFMRAEDLDHLLQVNCKSPDYPNLIRVTENYINQQKRFYENKASFPPGIIAAGILKSGEVGFESARKIKKGSEIFFPYGFTYWANLSIRICERKGLPVEAMRIRNAISNAVTRLTGLVKESPESSKYFTAFLSDGDLAEVVDYISSFPTEIRLASLFLPPQYFRFFVLSPEKELQMFSELRVQETLGEIAERPNIEFYDPERGVHAHPKSIELARSMNHWGVDQATFTWAFRNPKSPEFNNSWSEMEEYLASSD